MDKGSSRGNILKIFLVCFLIFSALILSLFNHWEIGGETWGYWFFAKVFAETGRFIILDRSPLYTLYLNLFLWLGYPLSVTVEYLATFFIVISSLVFFLRPYLGFRLSIFSAILWLPFLRGAEPTVQALALACSCLALIARRSENKIRIPLSYALFIFAYMFRSTYFIFVVIFGLWDIARVTNKKQLNFSSLRKLKFSYLLPVFLPIALLLYFSLMQSPHRWNNAWFATTKWFPSKGKTLSEAGFIQNSNWMYIQKKYGAFEGKDFYFTNQELFKGANNIPKAIFANPKYVIWQCGRNFKNLFLAIEDFYGLTAGYLKIGFSGLFFKILRWLVVVSLVTILFYGSFRLAGTDMPMALFIVGNMFILGLTVIAMPKIRYLPPLVPVIILSSVWFSGVFSATLARRMNFSPKFLTGLIIISLFSLPAVFDWVKITKDFTADIKQKDFRVLEKRQDFISMRGAYKTIAPLIKNCRGVMSINHLFIAAFIGIESEKVYDVFEIPPFGDFCSSSEYNGLTKERVNCLLLSSDLKNSIGFATNCQIRYQNYIKPYAQYLNDAGAAGYKVPEIHGELIILSQD